MLSGLNNFTVKRHLYPFSNIALIPLMSERVYCPANVGKAYEIRTITHHIISSVRHLLSRPWLLNWFNKYSL